LAKELTLRELRDWMAYDQIRANPDEAASAPPLPEDPMEAARMVMRAKRVQS